MNLSNRKILTAATFVFFVVSYIEDTLPFGKVFTLVSLIAMLFAHASIHGYVLKGKLSLFYVYLIVFWLYSILSLVWTEDRNLTMIIVRGHFFILLTMSVVYWCNSTDTLTYDLLKIVMYGGYTVVLYAFFRYGPRTILSSIADDVRLNDDVINANTLGMCAAYSMVINFHFFIYGRRKWADLLMLPSLVIIASSGSRKSLVILGAGVFAVLILKNLHNRDFFKKAIKILAAAAVLAALAIAVLQLPMFAVMRRRMTALIDLLTGSGSQRTDGNIRMIYNRIGWDLFRQHPITGIGLHNAQRYIGHYYQHVHLHNNIVELLACGGIIGFTVYYSVYAYLAVMFWKLRRRRDPEYDICLTLFVIRLVMGYGHIQYRSAATYFFLMLFLMEIYRLKRKKNFSMESFLKA